MNYYDLLLSMSKNSRWKIIVVDKIIAILGLLVNIYDYYRKLWMLGKGNLMGLLRIRLYHWSRLFIINNK